MKGSAVKGLGIFSAILVALGGFANLAQLASVIIGAILNSMEGDALGSSYGSYFSWENVMYRAMYSLGSALMSFGLAIAIYMVAKGLDHIAMAGRGRE